MEKPLFSINQKVYVAFSCNGSKYEVKEHTVKAIEFAEDNTAYKIESIFDIRYNECDCFESHEKAMEECDRRNNIHKQKSSKPIKVGGFAHLLKK